MLKLFHIWLSLQNYLGNETMSIFLCPFIRPLFEIPDLLANRYHCFNDSFASMFEQLLWNVVYSWCFPYCSTADGVSIYYLKIGSVASSLSGSVCSIWVSGVEGQLYSSCPYSVHLLKTLAVVSVSRGIPCQINQT